MQNLKEIYQEMWPAERTKDFHQNMTFDPMKEIRQEMQLIEHTQDFHQNMTFHPIKDGTLGAASQQTIGV